MSVVPTRSNLLRWTVLCIILTNAFAQRCTRRCPKRESPVCGSDGKTYKNQCKLENRRCQDRSLYRVRNGPCRGCKRPCGNAYEPVCGSDGVTYDNLCRLDNAACDNPMVSMQANGECRKEVILLGVQVDLVGAGLNKGPTNVTFELLVISAPGSQSISGQGLWKLGIFGCRYDDGWCDKIGHLPQILSPQQASTPLVGGQEMVVRDIVAHFDISIIGCDDLPYICAAFSKGDNPRPDFALTMGFEETAINCWPMDCPPVTDPPVVTPACRYECPESGHVVCGSDGETYSTECALDNERRCGEDPESYLLTRKHYGPCRTGVIIDSMFWSAQPKRQEEETIPSGNTLIIVEVLVMSNSTGESISGRNLWRVGLYGSQFADGSGPRLGYIHQLLDNGQASTTLAAGRAIVLNAEVEFDAAAVGCSRYKFLCLEFTKGDSPQPPFPFHGNAGPEEASVFMSCRQVPCQEIEPEFPDDGRVRVVVGQFGWGLRARGRRPDGLYNVTVNLNVQIMPTSDYVAGSNLLRVGLFGSQNQNGTGPRLGFHRQILTSRDTSRTFAPSSNLVIDDIETTFPVTRVGCSDYGFLCLELAKDNGANPDFIFVSENTDTTSTPDEVILCKQIRCRKPGGSQSGGQGGDGGGDRTKIGRIESLRWRLSVKKFKSPKASDLFINITTIEHPGSEVITGDGLWRVGIYASDDSNPYGPKYRYQKQILSVEQQSIPLHPDAPLEIFGVNVRFNVQSLGCGQLNYICIEFTKGDSPRPDFQLPLPQNDTDGVTKRIASCKPWPCQDSDGDGGNDANVGKTGGDTGGQGGGMGGQGGGTGGQGGGMGGHGGGTGGHGGGAGNQGGGGHLPEPGPDAPFVAFRNLHWTRYRTPVNQKGPSMVNLAVILTPHDSSDALEGFNLWKVGLFGSDVSNNTGVRFDERPDVLSATDRSSPLVPGNPLVFNITTPFEMHDVGCGTYPYLCIEFSRDKFSWPAFRLALGKADSVVSCQYVTCDPNAGQGGSSNRGHGGTLDPNLPTASFHNISWNIVAGDTRPGVLTDLNVHVVIFPKSYTDSIRGRRLWRLGLFGNTYRDGTGVDRVGYITQILSPKQAKKPLVPNSPLEFNVDTRFLLHNFGCDLHRYLCLEFAQHDHPEPPFNFPVETDAHVSCKPYLCQNRPSAQPRPNRPVARIGPFTWLIQDTQINSEGPTDIRLFVNVPPHEQTDIINGQNLWKVGIYGSKYSTGGEAFEDRLDYDPQLLQVPDARRTLAPSRPLNFDLHTNFDMRRLGCGPYKYFCVEFGKDHLANPDFEMGLAGGDVVVNCQRMPCHPNRGTGDTGGPDHTGGQPDPDPIKIVGFIRVDWQVGPPNIYPDGQSDLHILVELTPHPDSDTIMGEEGSGFWRVGIFANRKQQGTHAQKINYDRQILSQQDRDQSLLPPNPLHFDINVPFDLRRANCESEFPFLCLEIAKGDSAWPDFNLPLPEGTHAFVTCQSAPCLPRDHHGGGGHSDLPVVTVTTINIGGVNIQPDARNDLELDAVVYMSPDSMAIRGTNLWQLAVWGSTVPDGSGPRIQLVDQVLSQQLADRNFVPPEPLFFPTVPFSLDMTGRECGEVTHICAEFSKLEPSNPPFQLAASPDTSVLTVCQPVECHAPRNPQIAVTGLSLFHSGITTIYAGRSNQLVIGVRVRYDEPESVGFQGTDLWGLKIWLSPKPNGKGKKLGAVKQALNDEQAAMPLVVGRDLAFQDISFRASLLGKKCKEARHICASLFKNPRASPSYILIAKPNVKKLTKCMPVNCA
ncbi:uncharacterized protein LOC110975788 [Acanthaster planci]|uniref:Uncharacterized protein LOC110975788 n=1 Tax=Acanthaster planci TaxID=133434 RepID=A0A8B7XW55_ACAPL|nr:uncharacterized protein LOC110975788 [Acanthaster planci]